MALGLILNSCKTLHWLVLEGHDVIIKVSGGVLTCSSQLSRHWLISDQQEQLAVKCLALLGRVPLGYFGFTQHIKLNSEVPWVIFLCVVPLFFAIRPGRKFTDSSARRSWTSKVWFSCIPLIWKVKCWYHSRGNSWSVTSTGQHRSDGKLEAALLSLGSVRHLWLWDGRSLPGNWRARIPLLWAGSSTELPQQLFRVSGLGSSGVLTLPGK